MNRDRTKERKQGEEALRDGIPGIVIVDGRASGVAGRRGPRIRAFVWGGKVRPTPTLPYGRWKGVA